MQLIFFAFICIACSAPSFAQIKRHKVTFPNHYEPHIDDRATKCRDPNLIDGVCIMLRSCQVLLDKLIANPTDTVLANYLRASNVICGKKDFVVCCPLSIGQLITGKPFAHMHNKGKTPPTLPTPEQGCGYTMNSFNKIIGGEVSKKGAWPWIALIGYNDELSASHFKCDGTLVTARHVITAAHCIRSDLSFVRLGEHDLGLDTEAEHVDIPVVRKEVNPEYNKLDGYSDIAILYLGRNVDITEFIAPICLPSSLELRRMSYVDYTPIVVGWDKLTEGGKSGGSLQQLQILIYNNPVCKNIYEKHKRLLTEKQFDSTVICAGLLSSGKDICLKGSGGPLIMPVPYQRSHRYYLIGVKSYGIESSHHEIPCIYTSAQHFMDWIIEKIADTE